MKYIKPIYHRFIDTKRIISECLFKARSRHGYKPICRPNPHINNTWEDCLTAYPSTDGLLNILLYYNIGEYTYSETATVYIKNKD